MDDQYQTRVNCPRCNQPRWIATTASSERKAFVELELMAREPCPRCTAGSRNRPDTKHSGAEGSREATNGIESDRGVLKEQDGAPYNAIAPVTSGLGPSSGLQSGQRSSRVNVGLDFGTSATKVCATLVLGADYPVYVVPIGGCDDGLCPSLAVIDRKGCLHLTITRSMLNLKVAVAD